MGSHSVDPLFPPGLSLASLVPSDEGISVSTGVRKLTNECCEIVARMLALQLCPDEIAVLVGVSVWSVYRIQAVCAENGGAYKISRVPSRAGRPSMILEDDINVRVTYTQLRNLCLLITYLYPSTSLGSWRSIEILFR
jgi:hypothetical protein